MERGYWIRSKPVYSTLVWQQHATAHLVLAEGDAGALAAIRLFQQMQPAQHTLLLHMVAEPAGGKYSAALQAVVADELQTVTCSAALAQALHSFLSGAVMGLRLYVAGCEQFMWSVAEIAQGYGINDVDIYKELTGTLARSVYCVHCKTISHQAHHNVSQCDGCGRMLFIRDHFSRRLGAYMGLMVDAEAPGELPEIVEIFP